jgi:hypothetical protein
MKIPTTFAMACLLLLVSVFLTGCNPGRQSPPSGRFQVDVDQITKTDDLVILRLRLKFAGERRVTLSEENDSETATISPDSETGLAECEVLLVADVVDSAHTNIVKWLDQIQGKGVRAGGPATYQMEPGKSLADQLDVHIRSGDYDFDSDLDIATFRGRTLRMKIQK